MVPRPQQTEDEPPLATGQAGEPFGQQALLGRSEASGGWERGRGAEGGGHPGTPAVSSASEVGGENAGEDVFADLSGGLVALVGGAGRRADGDDGVDGEDRVIFSLDQRSRPPHPARHAQAACRGVMLWFTRRLLSGS